MKRTRMALLVFAVLPAATIVQAQQYASKPATASTGAPEPKKERAISKEISAAVSSGISYVPPPPSKPDSEEVDLRDSDKPRNDIIRLPKYVVEEKRPPVFTERNLYTREMLRRLAYLRYTSAFSRNVLNRYHIFGQSDIDYAMMVYEAEERKRNIAEMEDKIAMYRISGDNAAADQLKDDTQRTFMRHTSYISPSSKSR